MQSGEIGEKAAGQHADLAAREREPIIGGKRRADFLPLAVVQKARKPDVNHDVVTYDAVRRYDGRKSAIRFLPAAAANTHPHSLPQAERAVFERRARPFPCLLYSRRSSAFRTALRRLFGIDQSTGNTLRTLLTLLLQLANRPPQARDLGQRNRAVFFTA